MQEPQLLKLDLTSSIVVDPTVMAEVADAGEYEHASWLSFPAATTMTTPALTALATAALIVLTTALLPRLMLATHNPPSSRHFFTT